MKTTNRLEVQYTNKMLYIGNQIVAELQVLRQQIRKGVIQKNKNKKSLSEERAAARIKLFDLIQQSETSHPQLKMRK